MNIVLIDGQQHSKCELCGKVEELHQCEVDSRVFDDAIAAAQKELEKEPS